MPTKSFGKRLQEARKNAGLTYMDAAFEIRHSLTKAQRVTNTTIRRWEHDLVPEDDVDPVVLWALAKAYGVSVEKLSPAAAEWCKTHLVQGEHPSRWIDVRAGHESADARDGVVRPGSRRAVLRVT